MLLHKANHLAQRHANLRASDHASAETRDHAELAERLINGERRALAKAITLAESQLPAHREQAEALIEHILPRTGNSVRVGISGVPGVGKSTLIEAFGLYLIGQGKKVAVLAVDPSSPLAGGSIMGDKTRMEELTRHPHAFIRPSPSRGTLGGVAQRTREAMFLCEAAGFDVIIVETVGVGQSECQVAAMVDCFMLLLLPNAGDELQGIKRGIVEMANLIVINKADGDNRQSAQLAKSQYQTALRFSSQTQPDIFTYSALTGQHIDQLWQSIQKYVSQGPDWLQHKRQGQNSEWMKQLLREMLEQRSYQNPQVRENLTKVELAVAKGMVSPLAAARGLVGYV
jgi:LAO/AO transport system kinase